MRRLALSAMLSVLSAFGTFAALSHAASPIPESLDAYAAVKSDGATLSLGGRTMVYQLQSPLFTDYALKFRTITLPAKAKVAYTSPNDLPANSHADSRLEFPVGTVISKTFYYPRDPETKGGWLKADAKPEVGETIDLSRFQLIETRILRRDRDGSWQANTYIWDAAQKTATLRRIGLAINATLRDLQDGRVSDVHYGVPNARQCQTCHAVDSTKGQAGIQPIGTTAHYLNTDYPYVSGRQNQLQRLKTLATVEGLPEDLSQLGTAIAYRDTHSGTQASLESRARAYVEINCAHCHNPLGDARQSGLFLTARATGSALGVCKQHVAAGSGGGDLLFDIVPGKPGQSLLISRMLATSGQAMMPRVGRSLVDREGIALLSDWISAMPGNCDAGR